MGKRSKPEGIAAKPHFLKRLLSTVIFGLIVPLHQLGVIIMSELIENQLHGIVKGA